MQRISATLYPEIKSSKVIHAEMPNFASAQPVELNVDGLAQILNSAGYKESTAITEEQAAPIIYQLVFNALLPVLKNQQQNSVTIFVSNKPITLTEQGEDLLVEIDNQQAHVFGQTLSSLFEVLYRTLYIAKDESDCYENRYWMGRLYHKNHPLPESIKQYYKSQPYRTISKFPPIDLNGQAFFTLSTQQILCRHIVTWYIKSGLEDQSGKGKPNLLLCNTAPSISEHITIDIEGAYETLLFNAESYDEINNAEFGSYLQTCFLDMQKPEKGEKIRFLLLNSTNHSMGIRLSIKGTEDKPIFVVNFFDPNITNEEMRVETSSLDTFQQHTLEMYVNGLDKNKQGGKLYDLYFRGNAPTSIILKCSLTSFTGKPIPKENQLKRIASGPLTPTHIHYLLAYNCAVNLAKLKDQLQQIAQESPHLIFDLLAANRGDGTAGLLPAVGMGCTKVIQVYRDLLPLIPEDDHDQLMDLIFLAAQQLSWAVTGGHIETIQEFGKLLQLFPADVIYGIGSKLADDTNLLEEFRNALQNGKTDVIKAFIELVKLTPKNERMELIDLIVAMKDEIPALILALRNGHTKAIQCYGELLELIPSIFLGPIKRDLCLKLTRQNEFSISELDLAKQNGHMEAIKACESFLTIND